MAKIKVIKDRLQKARADRAQYDNYIDTAFRYSIPQRRIYLEAQNKLRPNPEVYDSTAVIGVQRFATKLQSMLVPPTQTWMKLTAGSNYRDNDDMEEMSELQIQYDKDTEAFFEEIKHSNFDTQVAESFQDLAVTTGALLINPSPIGSHSSVTYKAVPISELYIENPSDGDIKTVFREHKLRLDQIEGMYVGATLSARHEAELVKDPNATVVVTESCIHDTKTDSYDIDVCDTKDEHYFLQRVETISPWVVFRENVVAGAALGFGRVLRVLPDIKMVNKVKQLLIQGGSIAVSGTFTAHDDGVLNPYNVRLRPGGVIPVNSNDRNNPSIARLDTPTNFDWGNMEIADLKAVINDMLLSNPYGSIEQTPVRSATEIAARNRELFDSVSSSFGRMQTEFIAKVIKRSVYIMQQANRLGEHIKLDGRETSYDFVSPLTRLQQSADIENVLEWLSVVGTFGEETLQLTANMEKVPAWLAEQYSVPQELVKSTQEQQKTVEAGMAIDQQNAAQGGSATPLAAPSVGEAVGVASAGGLSPMF